MQEHLVNAERGGASARRNAPARWRACGALLGGSLLGLAVLAGRGQLQVGQRHAPETDSERTLRRLQLHSYDDCPWWPNRNWTYLTGEERLQLGLLGWSDTLWDNRTQLATPVLSYEEIFGQAAPGPTTPPRPAPTGPTKPASDLKCWNALTTMEQDALRRIGMDTSPQYGMNKAVYLPWSWNTCRNYECPSWPEPLPRSGHTCTEMMSYFEQLYSVEWKTLSPWEQETWRNALGWTQARWENRDKPDDYASEYNSLARNTAKGESLQMLGMTPDVWNGCPAEIPCMLRRRMLEDKLDAQEWRPMPLGVQRHLVTLGWTERAWVEGERPVLAMVPWDALSGLNLLAAQLLGFREDTWDMCPISDCRDRLEYLRQRWSEHYWTTLKNAEQRAWRLLGQSEVTWTKPSFTNIYAAAFQRWDELTPEAREAAKFLGHSEASWAGCAEGWETPKQDALTKPLFDDPERTVRATMTIIRPFSEISGNVYGQEVAALPTSFIKTFETSIARVLYCGNPASAADPSVYLDGQEAICNDRARFEDQKRRVQVVSIRQGSIIVDFIICGQKADAPRGVCDGYTWNATHTSAAENSAYIQRQLELRNSSLIFDKDFGRFAEAASVEEVRLRTIQDVELEKALTFERLRAFYGEQTACELLEDRRNNISYCVDGAIHFATSRLLVVLLLFNIVGASA